MPLIAFWMAGWIVLFSGSTKDREPIPDYVEDTKREAEQQRIRRDESALPTIRRKRRALQLALRILGSQGQDAPRISKGPGVVPR